MTIPISALTNYNGSEWEDYLDKVCLIDIFKDIISEFGNDKVLTTSIIRYIVWAYSVDSDKIVMGMDWLKNKKKIFDDAQLPVKSYLVNDEDFKLTFYDGIVLLKHDKILSTIKRWLDFQDDENFCNFITYNDLLIEMRVAANSPIKKSSAEIDYQSKMYCAESIKELMKMKKEAEETFLQNNEKMKEDTEQILE